MIAHNPLHRSRRAALPHRALASGHDGQALLGIEMHDSRCWEVSRDPASKSPLESSDSDMFLTAAPQCAPPQPDYRMSKQTQRWAISGHSVIVEMPLDYSAQAFPHFVDRVVQMLSEPFL